MIAAAINAPSKAYSIEVTPASEVNKLFNTMRRLMKCEREVRDQP